MTARHYYNEFDPRAAEWLRELMKAGLIPQGDVDERSITEVAADDLRGYRSVHLFAGIGGWAQAIRLAGWDDERPVWTGSCPCQPYSSAGKQKGNADARNLWPAMFRLIRECRPDVCFGEQVEGAIRHGWLDGVSADLEGEGYAIGSAVLGAHSVGSPTIRQRLFWVADTQVHRTPDDRGAGQSHPERNGSTRGMADAPVNRLHEQRRDAGGEAGAGRPLPYEPAVDCAARRLADPDGGLPGDGRLQRGGQHGQQPEDSGTGGGLDDAPGERAIEHRPAEPSGDGADDGIPGSASDRLRGFWSAFDLIPCRDGKSRRVEPGTFPLAHGVSGRVGMLRGYGNAICPQTAAEFIRAWEEAREEVNH